MQSEDRRQQWQRNTNGCARLWKGSEEGRLEIHTEGTENYLLPELNFKMRTQRKLIILIGLTIRNPSGLALFWRHWTRLKNQTCVTVTVLTTEQVEADLYTPSCWQKRSWDTVSTGEICKNQTPLLTALVVLLVYKSPQTGTLPFLKERGREFHWELDSSL